MKNFAENLRNEIEEKKITPLPEYLFWVKNFFIALFFLLSLVIGGIVLSLLIYSFLEGGFEGVRPFYIEIIRSLPFLWIVSFVLFSAFALWGLHHFPKGYKISFPLFLIINLACTFLLAGVLYFSDFPEFFQKYERNIPFHTSVQEQIEQDWNNPEEGFLSGVVIASDDNYIVLETISGEQWKVLMPLDIQPQRIPGTMPSESSRPEDRPENRPERERPERPTDSLRESNPLESFSERQRKFIASFQGKRIKIIGEISSADSHEFSADKMMPWRNNRFKPCRDKECEDFENQMKELREE